MAKQRPTKQERPRTRAFDESWKLVLERYFWECLDFYFPHIAKQIDQAQGYTFLDQELQQIVPKSRSQKRRIDKLASVRLLDKTELWVLIHLEVQTYRETKFAMRMFSYHYRIWDKYQKPVASLAILADDNSKFRPKSFELTAFGKAYVHFEFEIAKLRDWKGRETELQQTNNIFGLVTLASLKAYEKNMATRAEWKYLLTAMLYERGYTAEDIIGLYRFLDGIMVLPDDLEIVYNDKITKLEEDKTMAYVTTAERIGIKKGLQEGEQIGLQKGKELGLQEGEQKGKLETAANMLRKGMELALIAELTGLPLEKIKELKKTLPRK